MSRNVEYLTDMERSAMANCVKEELQIQGAYDNLISAAQVSSISSCIVRAISSSVLCDLVFHSGYAFRLGWGRAISSMIYTASLSRTASRRVSKMLWFWPNAGEM